MCLTYVNLCLILCLFSVGAEWVIIQPIEKCISALHALHWRAASGKVYPMLRHIIQRNWKDYVNTSCKACPEAQFVSKRKGDIGIVEKKDILETEDCSLRNLSEIHSWTAETWATPKNMTRDREEILIGKVRSPEGKMMVLHELEKDLNENIESRILEFGGREARTKGMGSKESALITISLLTFAVYLIKLVKKLIDHIQTKKGDTTDMLVNGLPGVQQIVLSNGRKRRALQDQEKLIDLMQQLYF